MGDGEIQEEERVFGGIIIGPIKKKETQKWLKKKRGLFSKYYPHLISEYSRSRHKKLSMYIYRSATPYLLVSGAERAYSRA